MTTTIFLSVSRADHLDRVFAALELLTCDRAQTGLLAYVDGDQTLTELTRTYVEHSKFAKRRCVQRHDPKPVLKYDIRQRRLRIAAIKNESRALVGDCQYVFSVEDDTIVPPHALERLMLDLAQYPFAGFVQGVELGRWGVPYVGAWRADDVYDPKRLTTLVPLPDAEVITMAGQRYEVSWQGLEEIDAGGFYCYLAKREVYVAHEYRPFADNDLGPDIEFGLAMRQEGRHNYIDWAVQCEHRDGERVVMLASTAPREVTMYRTRDEWRMAV